MKQPCNKENMRKWIAALRSGEYQQGRHRLRTGDYFCCLGVACDILLGREAWGKPHSGVKPCHPSLPARVSELLGLEESDPRILDSAAIALNDGGFSFAQIADGLEATYDVEAPL